jgi:hypothetical protein
MERTVFYSWQTSTPSAANRNFIEKALRDSLSKLSSSPPIVSDRDTKGTTGSPDIIATILGKIDQATAMVADVTTAHPGISNSNVMFELGYAVKSIGFERIILVQNTHFGKPETLPFDLRHRRILTYSSDPIVEERAIECDKLTKSLIYALESIINLPSNDRLKVELHVDHTCNLVEQSLHKYRLNIQIKNNGTKSIENWHIDIQMPIQPFDGKHLNHQYIFIPNTTQNLAFFRTTSGERGPIHSGDILTFHIHYIMNQKLYEMRSTLFSQNVCAQLYIDGDKKQEFTKLFKELQSFLSIMKNKRKKKSPNYVDQNEASFRRLVDNTHPTINFDPNDIVKLYYHYQMDTQGIFFRDDVISYLYERISTCLKTSTSPNVDLFNLKSQIFLKNLADNIQLQPYYRIAETLCDAAKQFVFPFSDLERWKTAISAAKDFILIQPTPFFPDDMLKKLNKRENEASNAILFLRKKGYAVHTQHGRAMLSSTELKKISEEIDQKVKALGAFNIADFVFQSIKPHFDSKQHRHHIVRKVSTGITQREASIPWTYILNLAAKYPTYRAESSNSILIFQHLLELSRAYGTTFDLEPFSPFEQIFNVGKKLPNFLSQITVFDSMFTLVQWRPSDVVSILEGLFNWISPTIYNDTLEFAFQDVFNITSTILNWTSTPGPFIIPESEISRKSGVDDKRTKAVLLQLSHDATGPNTEFLIGNDQINVDLWFRPLIVESPDHYLIMDRSWCAPAFYETLANAARKIDTKKADSNIGKAFEELVRKKLRIHKVQFSCGDYDTPEGHAECDLVVETKDHIIFIEMKKKVLTRAARGGSQVAIFLDLAKSMFDAQIQLCGHELALYKYGEILLSDSSTIKLNNRRIERVALGLLDFGGMHDRIVMAQILETVINFSVSANRTEDETKILEVQKRAKKLREQIVELNKYRTQYPPFFNSWFLSLGHLYIVLDDVLGNESFKDSLFSTRHVTTGSLDFYYEHYLAKKHY